ncbi:MAG: hypothetical protein K2N95_06650, partial [Lachnospiraceae bacterium]|nr:hypothetical protein [Lachnospiraceae bacterium]
LADSGSWNEQALEEFKWIADRYVLSYIKERCDSRANPDYQRHPAGLRVFTHFFQRKDLPEEIYQIVWRKFGLKTIRVGRMKIFYGPLRDLVMERIPGIEGEEPANLLQLSQERNACFARIQADPEQEERELAAFFAQEKIQKVLRSRWFVEEQLLAYSNWMNPTTLEGAVRWLAAFYQENQDVWGWDQVVERANQELERREKDRKRESEEAAETAVPVELDLSLLLAFPKRVYAQPLTGSERVFCLNKMSGTGTEDDQREKLMTDREWEDFKDGEKWEYTEVEAEELTEEGLVALFDQFGEGALARLEIEFGQTTLVLVRDQDKYACFCFEKSADTWFSMLSQPEVYMTVDSERVAYLPFGMGMLATYCIHESPDSILRNMNLVFMQIGRGRIEVRLGDCWLWSSHTNLHNGWLKKNMAMQKLAQIPVRHSDGHILAKFVFSQYPDWMESVSLSGERTLARLRTGSYDLAIGSLAQFFQQKLAKLRLSWEPKGKTAQAGLRHIILLQDNGQFMMAWLQDDKEQASFYASDVPRIFLGRVYPACLVHRDLKRIRNCLDLLLDDMSSAELVTDRPGEFVPMDYPYAQVREGLMDEEA